MVRTDKTCHACLFDASFCFCRQTISTTILQCHIFNAEYPIFSLVDTARPVPTLTMPLWYSFLLFVMFDLEERKLKSPSLQFLRGNMTIDYEQLGLKFRLYSCEVLFNRGLSLIYMGREEEVRDKSRLSHDPCVSHPVLFFTGHGRPGSRDE
jgi:hypothetical protein